jgi:hypothetical protein
MGDPGFTIHRASSASSAQRSAFGGTMIGSSVPIPAIEGGPTKARIGRQLALLRDSNARNVATSPTSVWLKNEAVGAPTENRPAFTQKTIAGPFWSGVPVSEGRMQPFTSASAEDDGSALRGAASKETLSVIRAILDDRFGRTRSFCHQIWAPAVSLLASFRFQCRVAALGAACAGWKIFKADSVLL